MRLGPLGCTVLCIDLRGVEGSRDFLCRAKSLLSCTFLDSWLRLRAVNDTRSWIGGTTPSLHIDVTVRFYGGCITDPQHRKCKPSQSSGGFGPPANAALPVIRSCVTSGLGSYPWAFLTQFYTAQSIRQHTDIHHQRYLQVSILRPTLPVIRIAHSAPIHPPVKTEERPDRR